MIYDLPTTLTVNGKDCPIRSDYRAVLDILAALSDPDMTDTDKAIVAMEILYIDPPFEDAQEALEKVWDFIAMGQSDDKKHPRLMDWEQDAQWIFASVNSVAKTEVRSLPYLHWWTFMGYYMEIGDGTFAQIVSIRKKMKKGKKLEKYEKEFYRENRNMIDFKTQYSDEEQEFIKSLTGG